MPAKRAGKLMAQMFLVTFSNLRGSVVVVEANTIPFALDARASVSVAQKTDGERYGGVLKSVWDAEGHELRVRLLMAQRQVWARVARPRSPT